MILYMYHSPGAVEALCMHVSITHACVLMVCTCVMCALVCMVYVCMHVCLYSVIAGHIHRYSIDQEPNYHCDYHTLIMIIIVTIITYCS